MLSRRSALIPLLAVELSLFTIVCLAIAERHHRKTTGEPLPAAWFIPASEADTAEEPLQSVPAQETVEDSSAMEQASSADDTPHELVWQRTIGLYTLTADQNRDAVEARLTIVKDGQTVFSITGHRFFMTTPGETNEEIDLPTPGTDLTGEGKPNVVIMEWSGGAHCCNTYYIFELGDTFRLVDTIEARDGAIVFKDVDDDGIPEIRMPDYSYAYAFTCFAGSPAPEVILRYEYGHYQVATDLMEKPAPTDKELQTLADEVRNGYRTKDDDGQERLTSPGELDSSAALWREMLDLIYAGHEDLALRFFDMAWPEWAEGKEEALKKFTETVANSPWWQQVADDGGESD